MTRRPLSPPRLLALGMAGVILLGTLLLATPIAAEDGRSVGLLPAFFTATSAVCVTGLIVVDTPQAYSWFGEAVLLLLIQIGGLGYMTLSTLVGLALGRRMTFSGQRTLQESFSLGSPRDVMQFAVTVVKLTLVFEIIGAAVLTARWWSTYGPVDAAWLGLFHAVSAFNNAGFSLFSDSLIRARGDWVVNLTVALLIVAGGIGYLVLTELLRWRRGQPLSLHARLVLVVSGLLVVAGTTAFYLIERANPGTLGADPASQAGLAAFFQSVTARTAGFNTIDIGAMRTASLFLMLILMFIGAAPGGTGGGVKVSTFGVTVLALWATVRGLREPAIFWRRLPADIVARAFFISLIAFLAMNVAAGLLLVLEDRDLLRTLFEATSAFGTVGLSMGIAGSPLSFSASFSTAGQLVICALMFIGRLGPLTLAVALAGRHRVPRVRYPEGRVTIG